MPDRRLTTLDKCQAFVNCYTSWTDEGGDTDKVVKSKKISFNSIKFKTLLSSVLEGRGITLDYIIRVGDIVNLPIEVAELNANSNEVLAENTTFLVPDLTRDNSNVFNILRIIMTSTPGWNVIFKHATRRNGRQA